jgi:hypothetical protein
MGTNNRKVINSMENVLTTGEPDLKAAVADLINKS